MALVPNQDSTPEVVESRPLDINQIQKEYVSGGSIQAAILAIRRALPQYVDDLTKTEGIDLYERMMTDPVVESSVETIRLSVLDDGVSFVPAVIYKPFDKSTDKSKEADAKTAEDYRLFIERCFDGMAGDVASELLDCTTEGYKASEITLKSGLGEDKGRLVIKSIKGKHKRKIAFVVDDLLNVDGLIGVIHNQINPLVSWGENGYDPATAPNFIPRWKFVLASFRPRNGDPRGTSILRSAYNAWFIKTQVLPDYFKYLKQFATPGIIGKTPVDNGSGEYTPKTNSDGTIMTDAFDNPIMITAEMALFNCLLTWLNGSVLAVRGGTEIDLLKSEGDGTAFLNAVDYFDKQIAQAILGTPKATQEGKGGDKGGSSVAQDIIGLRVAHLKELISRVIYQDIVKLLIRVNFGDDAVRLAPFVVLKKVEQQDWARELDAVSNAYGKGILHDSQLPDIWGRFGFEPADLDEMRAEKEERMKLQSMAAGDMSTLMNPNGNDKVPTDKTPKVTDNGSD